MALTKGRKFSITIGNAITDPNTTSNFKTAIDAVGTNEIQFAPVTKEIEFKQPERTAETVKLLGETGGNQNQELDESAPSKGEWTGTILASPEDDNDFDFEQFMLTASSTTATGYDKRYNYASAEPTLGVAIVIQSNSGSGKPIINWLMNNAKVETLGGVKVDADGHATQDIRITSAADDCWIEWDTDGGS